MKYSKKIYRYRQNKNNSPSISPVAHEKNSRKYEGISTTPLQKPIKPVNEIRKPKQDVKITQEEKKTRTLKHNSRIDDLQDELPDFKNMNMKTLRAYVMTHNLRDDTGKPIIGRTKKVIMDKLELIGFKII